MTGKKSTPSSAKNKKVNLNLSNGFEYLDHPADVQVHAWGESLAQAFEQCVYALMDVMTNPKHIGTNISHEFDFIDDDKSALLIAFLSEFLFLLDARGLLFREIQIDPILKQTDGKYKLHAIGKGDQFDPKKHSRDKEVKAITYSYLEINETSNRTDIKIIYDI
jgi:SHS2 domain-containing protein